MRKIVVLATMLAMVMMAASPAIADDLLAGFDDDGPFVQADGLSVSATGGVAFDDDFGDDLGGGFPLDDDLPFGDDADDGDDDAGDADDDDDVDDDDGVDDGADD